MESKLIDIPNNELDEIINQNIEQSNKVLIVVSFIFKEGLELVFDKLKSFHNPSNITIITSNYLKSTEPKALRKLLELKSLGAKVYLFDSITSRENFHIKSYYFENEDKNFYSCFIGSSNISFSAFKLSHELNIEINDKKICKEHKDKMLNFLSHPNLLEINEEVISDYEKVYGYFIESNKQNNIFGSPSIFTQLCHGRMNILDLCRRLYVPTIVHMCEGARIFSSSIGNRIVCIATL